MYIFKLSAPTCGLQATQGGAVEYQAAALTLLSTKMMSNISSVAYAKGKCYEPPYPPKFRNLQQENIKLGQITY